jgi:predicted amino acid-binding ACT domain protein
MACSVRCVEYFSTTVVDQPGEACRLLETLAGPGINLLAFTAVPIGPSRTQLTLFPEDAARLAGEARNDNFVLDGPHPALLVQGDDELGVFAELHRRLAQARVNVYASTGLADGSGSFGYVIYVRPEEFARAAEAVRTSLHGKPHRQDDRF